MTNPQHKNLTWAQENGYHFHAETDGAISAGARSLDIFREAEDFRDHVLGMYRDRPFEILDFKYEVQVGGDFVSIWKTVVLIPTAGLDLPNFDLLPRREMQGMNFLGVKGLNLKLPANAPLDDRQLVDAFNKNYSLFAGGAFEAMHAAIKSADQLVPIMANMASICKPGVLRFLSTATTGYIEVQNGYLAICAPETRIMTGAMSDIILQGRERESLLAITNDLLDLLANTASETPLSGLILENTFNPRQVLGSVIGGVIGFLLGGFLGILLLFLPKDGYLLPPSDNYLFLIPVLALGGVFLGAFIGKTLIGIKSHYKTSSTTA
jgi:hypothetical protein